MCRIIECPYLKFRRYFVMKAEHMKCIIVQTVEVNSRLIEKVNSNVIVMLLFPLCVEKDIDQRNRTNMGHPFYWRLSERVDILFMRKSIF